MERVQQISADVFRIDDVWAMSLPDKNAVLALPAASGEDKRAMDRERPPPCPDKKKWMRENEEVELNE